MCCSLLKYLLDVNQNFFWNSCRLFVAYRQVGSYIRASTSNVAVGMIGWVWINFSRAFLVSKEHQQPKRDARSLLWKKCFSQTILSVGGLHFSICPRSGNVIEILFLLLCLFQVVLQGKIWAWITSDSKSCNISFCI